MKCLKPSDVDGYVYLAKCETGHYKVGRSKDPEKRIKHFDTQMPVEVNEWHFFPADDYTEAEKELHNICDEHGENKNGEWWELPEYMVWWIQDIDQYVEGDFYSSEWEDREPMEQPSESYANYAKHFGSRTHRGGVPPPETVARAPY